VTHAQIWPENRTNNSNCLNILASGQNRAVPTPRIDDQHLRAQLGELLQIPSVGGTAAEIDVQRHLASTWQAEGFVVDTWEIDPAALAQRPDFPGMEVERSTALGVMATLPGSGGGPTLLIDGHTDVVPPGDLQSWSGDPFEVRQAERDGAEVLVARGAADMKAGLMAGWAAMHAIAAAGIELGGDVIIAPVSGEEDGGLGTYALIQRLVERGIEVGACIVPEPTSLDLIPANGGALTFRLVVHGQATHASRRSEGVNAIEKFIPLVGALAELESQRNGAVDPLMQRWPIAYPLSLGTVQAGDWASTVPDLLTCTGRLGVALGEDVANARSQFEAAVAEVCDQDPWLREHPVQVQWWGGQFAPGRTDPSHPLLAEVARAHQERTGRMPQVYGAPYGSDLRLLVGLGGIPTVQYGPGDAAIAHTADEHVRVDEVMACAEVLVEVILRTCGVHARS
jgi:acetylornithine deacetylase